MLKERITSGGKAGFTLVELLIALAVSSIVLLAVISLFVYQTRSYNQQSQLARNQAQLRGALQFMTRDIRLAGYTGLALGIDRQNKDNALYQLFPVRAWASASLPGGTPLQTDAQYGQSEAIEIWGNFLHDLPVSERPYVDAKISANVLKIKRHKILINNHIKRIMIGNEAQTAYLEITGVLDGDTSGQFTVSPALTMDVQQGFQVSPIMRRIYFVTPANKTYGAFTESVGTLFQRTYMVDPTSNPPDYSQTCYVDEEIADHIDFMNLRYGLADAVLGRIDLSPDDPGSDNNEPPNPCAIRSIHLQLISRTPIPLKGEAGQTGRSGMPLTLDYEQDIQPRNVGLDNTACTFTNSLTAFTDTPCNLAGSTIGL